MIVSKADTLISDVKQSAYILMVIIIGSIIISIISLFKVKGIKLSLPILVILFQLALATNIYFVIWFSNY